MIWEHSDVPHTALAAINKKSHALRKAAMPQYDYLSHLSQAQQTVFTGMRRAGLPDE
jgi:hypothetical protein